MHCSAEGDSSLACQMTDPDLFGSVLYTAIDTANAADALARILEASTTDRELAMEAGLDPVLVDTLRDVSLTEATSIVDACALGSAWVSGWRSAPKPGSWEPVVSLPGHLALPLGLRRTTAESLIGLANGAMERHRLAAPFMDEPGSDILPTAS